MEQVQSRAVSFANSRVVYTAATVVLAAGIVTVLVLVGIMVGRRDPDISAAVRHLWVQVDSERLPVLPDKYPGTDHGRHSQPDVMLIVGDAWAGGLGVRDTAEESWWAQLRARHFPSLVVVRSVSQTGSAGDVGLQIQQLRLPSTLQGRRVALVVQSGWNDVVAHNGSSVNVRALVTGMMADIKRAIANNTALQKAISLSIYVADYPDASAGSGFTDLLCAPPLDCVYNHPAAADVHLRALNMLSRALMVEAHARGYAFVPLRATLSNVGAVGLVRSMVSAIRGMAVDVLGNRIQSPAPAVFDRSCDSMGPVGQGYQADLVAAHLENSAYFIVG